MLLIKNRCLNPHFNLALDEYLLTARNDEFFTLWQNSPSVIIGRNQDALAEIDFDFLRQNNIALVRRMSGGGAVFHDLGNINFTYITRCEKTDFFNFARFAAPILSALKALGVEAQASGRNDLTIDDKKFSGNAQHLSGGRLLHHGTLLFDSDFGYMQGALRVDPEKLKGKGVASVKSRVTNIRGHLARDMDTSAFLDFVEEHILGFFPEIRPYELSESNLEQVKRLEMEKYRTDGWNFLHMGSYAFKNSARFPFGRVEVRFDVSGGVICGAGFSGDFFGPTDIGGLEEGLRGVPHTFDAVLEAFERLKIEDYISGAEKEQIATLFF